MALRVPVFMCVSVFGFGFKPEGVMGKTGNVGKLVWKGQRCEDDVGILARRVPRPRLLSFGNSIIGLK